MMRRYSIEIRCEHVVGKDEWGDVYCKRVVRGEGVTELGAERTALGREPGWQLVRQVGRDLCPIHAVEIDDDDLMGPHVDDRHPDSIDAED